MVEFIVNINLELKTIEKDGRPPRYSDVLIQLRYPNGMIKFCQGYYGGCGWEDAYCNSVQESNVIYWCLLPEELKEKI